VRIPMKLDHRFRRKLVHLYQGNLTAFRSEATLVFLF